MYIFGYDIDVPIRLPIHSKKSAWFYLNLNVYRNAHFYLLDKAKKMFEETIWNQVKDIPKFSQIELTYTLHPGSRKKMDVANTCCIVDKFFCDTLVHAGVIEDDDYKTIKKISFRMGEISKNNPHVTVTIEGIRE